MDRVATREGLGSSVGMISRGAVRCDRVTVPSALAHMMTIGEFAIHRPNPLDDILSRPICNPRSDLLLTCPSILRAASRYSIKHLYTQFSARTEWRQRLLTFHSRAISRGRDAHQLAGKSVMDPLTTHVSKARTLPHLRSLRPEMTLATSCLEG